MALFDQLGIDYMMRGSEVKNLFNDITLNVMPSYNIGESLRLFGKFGWEQTSEPLDYDFWGEYLDTDEMILANEETSSVMPAYLIAGEDYIYYGAGIEYFPLKEDKSVRLHAMWTSNNYTKRHAINIGLTWKFDLVNAAKHIARKVK